MRRWRHACMHSHSSNPHPLRAPRLPGCQPAAATHASLLIATHRREPALGPPQHLLGALQPADHQHLCYDALAPWSTEAGGGRRTQQAPSDLGGSLGPGARVTLWVATAVVSSQASGLMRQPTMPQDTMSLPRRPPWQQQAEACASKARPEPNHLMWVLHRSGCCSPPRTPTRLPARGTCASLPWPGRRPRPRAAGPTLPGSAAAAAGVPPAWGLDR